MPLYSVGRHIRDPSPSKLCGLICWLYPTLHSPDFQVVVIVRPSELGLGWVQFLKH